MASPQARRLAAVVLEVLAGQIGPSEAAKALGISPPRYYALEQRAILGLVSACEPGRTGSSRDPAKTLSALQNRCTRLEQERARYQALARAAQRALGLSATEVAELDGKAGNAAKRCRTARALVAAKRLKQLEESEGGKQPNGTPDTDTGD